MDIYPQQPGRGSAAGLAASLLSFSRSALASFLPAVHLLRQLLHPPRHLLGRSLPAYSLSVLFSRTRLLC